MQRDLFANAVHSIELGVEDFRSSDGRRLTSAVRNLYAGLLLLFKCVLEKNSPPDSNGALIFRDIEPAKLSDGTVTFRGVGNKTVDRYQIKKRLTSLGFEFDWVRLDGIAAIRNDMEHLHLTKPESLAKEAFSDSLVLIVSVLDSHLDKSAPSVFETSCWEFLKSNQEVYREAASQAWSSFSGLTFNSERQDQAMRNLKCTDCGSSLVRQCDPDNFDITQMEICCSECGANPDFETAFMKALDTVSYTEAYYAATQGGRPPLAMCDVCLRFTVCTDERICTMPACGPRITFCRVCGDEIEKNQMTLDYGTCVPCAIDLSN